MRPIKFNVSKFRIAKFKPLSLRFYLRLTWRDPQFSKKLSIGSMQFRIEEQRVFLAFAGGCNAAVCGSKLPLKGCRPKLKGRHPVWCIGVVDRARHPRDTQEDECHAGAHGAGEDGASTNVHKWL